MQIWYNLGIEPQHRDEKAKRREWAKATKIACLACLTNRKYRKLEYAGERENRMAIKIGEHSKNDIEY